MYSKYKHTVRRRWLAARCETATKQEGGLFFFFIGGGVEGFVGGLM